MAKVNEVVDNPEIVSEAKKKTTNIVKNYIFDIIAVGLIIAMFLLGLGVLEKRDITWKTLLDIVISFVPFYLCMQVLNMNYYTKGVFKGKESEVYKNAMIAYSKIAGSLTGEQQDTIYEFCEYYNADALKRLQTSILKRAAISYELFINGDVDKGIDALIGLTKEKLLTIYNKDQVKIIMKAKRAKVKGISANILLSNIQSSDSTDLGKTEKEMRNSRMTTTGILSFVSIFVLSLIGVKDIQEWGWLAAALVLFKMMYVFVKSYMQYFNAYNDITVGLVNHLARKSDILKQFDYWHNNIRK